MEDLKGKTKNNMAQKIKSKRGKNIIVKKCPKCNSKDIYKWENFSAFEWTCRNCGNQFQYSKQFGVFEL